MSGKKLILIFAGFFISVCLVTPVSAASDNDAAAATLCEYAMQLYKDGNVDDAMHQLNAALQINPDYSPARRYLNKIISEQGSLPDINTAQKNYPASSRAERIQADNTVERLRQFIQNKENQVAALTSQLQKAQEEKESLLNKGNTQKGSSPAQEEALRRSAQDKESQIKELSRQLEGFKSDIVNKDNMLKKLEDDLQLEKSNLVNKQQEMSVSGQDKQKQIEELNNQIARLEKEKNSYQGQLDTLKTTVSLSESERQRLAQELQSLKSQYAGQLQRKDADLKQAKQDYENRLLAITGELKAKELMVLQLKNDKAAMQQKGDKEKQERIARVERLMKEIEGILPEVSQHDNNEKNRQLDRIDGLMREIEEVLPKSETSLQTQ
jgi:chromosome segregation ATPase